MITELRNLTPHDINILYEGSHKRAKTFPSEGSARVAGVSKNVGGVCGVPVKVTEYGGVSGLPDPVEGVGLIVSRMVAAALPERDDLYVPGGLVRNLAGQVVGCLHLERI